ncbi:MAG: ATP-grasp domain-containing protein [Bdellovibrionaceae bacterium]|nr:ATP-grasp domain-containing protein [Bdellovibrionales bacterium]MCB9255193.1 ATP-grasp domain-containing protein [Pseudobdellovibrionaceae bacterium]
MKIAFVFNKKTSDSVEEAEFDTEETIEAIARALAFEGNEVVQVPMSRDEAWISELRKAAPDLVFNTAEGYSGIGRESYAPIVFEQLGIPYVGPGPYVCFLTLDKFLTKEMVSHRSVPVVEGTFITRPKELEALAKDIAFPAFVKPNYEGSSKGITSRSLCRTYNELVAYGKESLKQFPEGLIIERFIPGRDVSIGFLAGLPNGGILDPVEYKVLESMGEEWIYDYEYKNKMDEKVRAICPAQLSEEQIQKIKHFMKLSVESLGIVDLGRADFRVTPDGDIFFMEFNALPSLQPGAGIFEATQRLELTYTETIQKIVEAAIARMKIRGKRNRPSHRTSVRSPKVGLVYNLRRKQRHEEGFEQEAEFDSPKTIEALSGAIQSLGFEVIPIEATKELAEELKQKEVNVVFNIAEGIASRARESQVPAICDLLGVEHTGSDATCLSISLDKAVSKRLVSAEGVLTAQSKLYTRPPKKAPKASEFRFPVIVKPNNEGTSKGINEKSVVQNVDELMDAMQRLSSEISGPILVEEFVSGREFTVGVFGNSTLRVLGPLEIRFKEKKENPYSIYTLEAKMDDSPEDNEFLQLVCPVTDLAPASQRQLHNSAKKVFRALGCRDVARVDFRMDEQGKPYFLEINPLPGLTPHFSDLTIMAERLGVEYNQLIKMILYPAVQRWRANERRSLRARAMNL